MRMRPTKPNKKKAWHEKHKHEDIVEYIRTSNGVVKDIATHFGLVANWPIYDYLQIHPDAQEALDTARRYVVEERMDERETGIKTIAERIEEDPGPALKACMWYLEKHGKRRGYSAGTTNEFADKLAETIKSIRDEPQPQTAK